ncbi:MAG: YceI family protein [Pseudomonadota bacterium]
MQAMTTLRRTILLAFSILFLPAALHAQVTLSILPESQITVDGTSNKSDWTVTAQAFEGSITVNDGYADGPEVSAVALNVTAKEMKSGRSTIMDRLMWKTLNATQHANITYALTAAEVVAQTDEGYTLNTMGELTLSGETKEIQMEVIGSMGDDGQMHFVGQYPLLLTDYGMTPPTAMFGALRTGDEVIVKFDLVAAQQ